MKSGNMRTYKYVKHGCSQVDTPAYLFYIILEFVTKLVLVVYVYFLAFIHMTRNTEFRFNSMSHIN